MQLASFGWKSIGCRIAWRMRAKAGPTFPCGLGIRSGMILIITVAWGSARIAGAIADDARPRPVMAWASSPLEVRIAYDHALDPGMVKAASGGVILFGDDVGPGVRLETREKARDVSSPVRGTLRVASASLTDDGKTLILATDPHPYRTAYAPILDGKAAEITYTLSGAQAEFTPEGGGAAESIWWPSVDSTDVLERTRGSSQHERFYERLARPGRLTLRTRITMPRGKVSISLESPSTIEEPTLGGESSEVKTSGGTSRATWSAESKAEPMELVFDVNTKAGEPFRLSARSRRADDATERPIPIEWMTSPWSPGPPPKPPVVPEFPALLLGGDAKKGESVFFGETAKCSACHAVQGRGGKVGPDLSVLKGKSEATIHHDIVEPSATIHPDYLPFTVTTKDGRALVGVVRSEGTDRMRIVGTDAKVTDVLRQEIEEIRPSATSIMPVGLPGAIGEAGMRDLMAYLSEVAKRK